MRQCHDVKQKRHDDVRCAVSNPATAKATQKELTDNVDVGHVPLAEIRIELAGIIKRCRNMAMPRCGNRNATMMYDALSAIRQQRRQLKKNLLVHIVDVGHVPLAEIRIELAGIRNAAQEAVNAMMWEQKRHDDVRCAVGNPATAKATQKNLLVQL